MDNLQVLRRVQQLRKALAEKRKKLEKQEAKLSRRASATSLAAEPQQQGQIKKVAESLKGPVRCQAIYMMLHEKTKKELLNANSRDLAIDTVANFINLWSSTCADLTPRENQLLRQPLFISLQISVRCIEVLKEGYDCSSYFRIALADQEEKLKKGIQRESETYCPPKHRYELTGFSWEERGCIVEITLKSNMHEITRYSGCYASLRNVQSNGLAMFWGEPWGCSTDEILTKITPSYSVKRQVPSTNTYQEEDTASVECNFPFFERNRTFKARWWMRKMNDFGGYYWVEDEASGCFYGGIANITVAKIKKVAESLKGPVRCQAIYMMLHEKTKKELLNANSRDLAIDTVANFINLWSSTCADLTPRENQLLRQPLFISLQMFIRMIVINSKNAVVSGKRLYPLLYRIMLVLNRHTQSCGGPFMSISWQTSRIGVFRYSAADAQDVLQQQNMAFEEDDYSHGVGGSVLEPDANADDANALLSSLNTRFALATLREAIPIGITCFEMKYYQHLINLENLKPVGDVCFFVSFHEGSTKVKRNSAPRDGGENSYKGMVPRKCTTERREDEGQIVCVCFDFGLIAVSQTTDRSLNLRTQVTGTIVLENSFQTFAWITLFLNILSLIILFFSSVSRYLRRAYRIQQSRYSIKFRDFSFFLMASDLCFAYSHYMGLEQCHDFKNCQSHGPSMLSWRYFDMLMHFNYTLAVVLAKRTQQLEGLMFNLTIGAFIATRVVNEVMRKHYSDKFLNSGCMPIHFRIMVVRPTAVILVLTFILLVDHLRSANHRYMAEWLGCTINALGGLVILILMSFMTHGDTSVGSNNFVGLTFSSVFVMCLVDTIYYTFLKPNMILYYHRLYLVTVHKKTLENAAVEQLTSPLLSCMYKLDTDTAAKEGRSRVSTRTSSTATSSSLNTTSDSDYSTSRDSSRKSKDGDSESFKDNKP
nr:unnamed protein product [Spirometra erinaceieuropaei]